MKTRASASGIPNWRMLLIRAREMQGKPEIKINREPHRLDWEFSLHAGELVFSSNINELPAYHAPTERVERENG